MYIYIYAYIYICIFICIEVSLTDRYYVECRCSCFPLPWPGGGRNGQPASAPSRSLMCLIREAGMEDHPANKGWTVRRGVSVSVYILVCMIIDKYMYILV